MLIQVVVMMSLPVIMENVSLHLTILTVLENVEQLLGLLIVQTDLMNLVYWKMMMIQLMIQVMIQAMIQVMIQVMMNHQTVKQLL